MPLSEIASEPQAADAEPQEDAFLPAAVVAVQIEETVTETVILETSRSDAQADASEVQPDESQAETIEPAPVETAESSSAEREPEMAEDDRPRRRGWWSGNR